MIKYQPDNWYGFLVGQSKTGHIYDLIHNGLPHDFSPDDPIGLVAINPDDMPPGQTAVPLQHLAKTAVAFDENGLMLLRNDCLTDYLEIATGFSVYEGHNSDYVLLCFRPQVRDDEDDFDDDDDQENEIYTGKNSTDSAYGNPLVQCRDLIVKCEDKEQALIFAFQGHVLLDAIKMTAENCFKLGADYNTASFAYVWNDRLHLAKIADKNYIFNPAAYITMREIISPYLELLIAKKQSAYLEELFSYSLFKQKFLPHYEAYISLLVNPHYECSRMFEMIDIVNRVNNGLKKYV